jgi:hypothetical protein
VTARIRDLQKRLEREPNNLGLRVTLAGALHQDGRVREAVELYRSVAIAYRDLGRNQQAIAVCNSILELVPDDAIVRTMLTALAPDAAPDGTPEPPSPASDTDITPIPEPLPHHVARPTIKPPTKPRGTAPPSTRPIAPETKRPSADDAPTRPGAEPRRSVSGLAVAARRISGMIAGDAPRGDEPQTDEDITVPRDPPTEKD